VLVEFLDYLGFEVLDLHPKIGQLLGGRRAGLPAARAR
jgi:hypothetical protein